MQDDNTTQPAVDSTQDGSTASPEPELSLGTNPASSATESQAGSTEPAAEDTSAVEPAAASTAADDSSSAGVSDTAADIQPAPSGASEDLEAIKSSVLQELMPIVSELDQEPEDKYRTLMMLIQASDNQALIKDAYDAAQKIEDNKAKAEALLNIVNEINYFTGKAGKPENES